MTEDSWELYSKLVMKSIEDLQAADKEVERRIRELETRQAVIMAKIGVYAAVVGGLMAAAVSVIPKLL